MRLIIGSRGSHLALFQANLIRERLSESGVEAEIKIIKTTGDRIDTLDFDKIEGKSFFTKELEDALLAKEIDLAVHSLKDLSTQLPDGLCVGAYCDPEDSSEFLLIRPEGYDADGGLFLKKGAIIGTSSVRRQAQIAHLRPDLKIAGLRGNVPTRILRLREGRYDAILIAYAGVHRLNLDVSDLCAFRLDPEEFIPAPGQGILAVEIRKRDSAIADIVARLNVKTAQNTATLERGLLARFQGGCQLPLAVTSKYNGDEYSLRAFLGIRKGEGWGSPMLFSGRNNLIPELIEQAYRVLTQPADGVSAATMKKKVLVTRTVEEGSPYFDRLSNGAEIIYYPVYQVIRNYDGPIISNMAVSLPRYDWIVFTSKNAVKIFSDILKRRDIQVNPNTKIAAVGGKTADFLRKNGYSVTLCPRQEDSSGLYDELSIQLGGQSVNILLPQGVEALDTLEKNLMGDGHWVTRVNIYKTVPTVESELPAIASKDIDFFVFTSPLSVVYFKELGHTIPRKSWVASIGRPTAGALAENFRMPDYIPDRADLHDIARKIREHL